MTVDPVRADSAPRGFSAREAFAWVAGQSIPAIVVGVCIVHIALSVWQGHLVQVNNDAILYVRMANLITDGRLAEARALFPWFTYPLLISGGVVATGLDPVIVARLLDSVATMLTMLLILRSAWVSLPSRTTVLCAAALLLGNLWLNELRPTIVREHFYFLFMVGGFYCLLRDLQLPRPLYKIGFVVATAVASLFRVEALGFLIFVPLLRVTCESRSRVLRAGAGAALLLGPVGAVLGLAYWNNVYDLSALFARPLLRIAILREHVLWPFEFRKAGYVYAAMVAALVLYALVNSIGLSVIALIAVGVSTNATFRRSTSLYLATLYLAVGALVLSAQGYFNLVLDPRHGLVLSLILTVPAALAFADLVPLLVVRSQRLPRVACGLVAVLLLIGFFAEIRFYDARRYEIDAGKWLAAHVSKDARVIGNSNQILFYAGFVADDPQLVLDSASHTIDISGLRNWKQYDAVVLELRKDQLGQVPALDRNVGQPPTQTFENGRGDKILIYNLR